MPGPHRGSAADELAEVFARSDEDMPTRAAIRKGIITATSYSTRTCTVQIDGVTSIPGVAFLDHYYPVVNDVVLLQRWGTSLVIVGCLSSEQWVPYTPTWTANAGTPSLGNGTLVGEWCPGPKVFFHLQLVIGSTSTFGSGGNAWAFSLPTTIATPWSGRYAADSHYYDASAGGLYHFGWELRSGTAVAFPGWSGGGGVLGNGTPVAPGTGDLVEISGWYVPTY
jgi:hypothetical protein